MKGRPHVQFCNRKSRNSLNLTFNLNTLCLTIWFTRLKITCVKVRSQKLISGNPPQRVTDVFIRVALNLTNRTLYLQHFMSIVNRNPISSFSGTGWSKNSMAWKRWLFWNNWSLQWSKKKNNLNEQNFKVYWKIRSRIEKSGIEVG